MKLIVGLGNPGKEYKNNRHNVGYLVCDQITKNQYAKIKSQKCNSKFKILKPDQFMNNSGQIIAKESNYYKISPENIFVIHDDMDLEFGVVRISFGSSSAGHNGVQSIIDELDTNNFWRIRVGIGRPPENILSDKYVLQDFTADERKVLLRVIDFVGDNMLKWTFKPKEATLVPS